MFIFWLQLAINYFLNHLVKCWSVKSEYCEKCLKGMFLNVPFGPTSSTKPKDIYFTNI